MGDSRLGEGIPLGNSLYCRGQRRKSAMQIAGRSEGGLHSAQSRTSPTGAASSFLVSANQVIELVEQLDQTMRLGNVGMIVILAHGHQTDLAVRRQCVCQN